MVKVQMTDRDRRMLDWLGEVRMADLEAVRVVLGVFSGAGAPVSLRSAQLWVKRMLETGYLDRGRPAFRDGSVVWPTYTWTNKVPLSIYRQTVRHQVAIANISSRFLAAGYAWSADPKTGEKGAHITDGLVRSEEIYDFVEVELTPKSSDKYFKMRPKFAWRLEQEPVRQVFYFGTADALHAVREFLINPRFMVEDLRARFVLVEAFNAQGRFESEWTPPALATDASIVGGGMF